MGYINFNGEPIDLDVHMTSDLFRIDPIVLPKGANTVFPGDGIYAMNPWVSTGTVSENNRIYLTFKLLDADGGTLYSGRNPANYVWRIDGLNVRCDMVRNWVSVEQGIFTPWTIVATLTETPSYVTYSYSGDSGAVYSHLRMAYQRIELDTIDPNLQLVRYITTDRVGLLEQFNDFSVKQNIAVYDTEDEQARRQRTELVRQVNHMRDAIRLGTYNIARNGQAHWYKIKTCLQNYGIDICGLQEVQYPNGDGPSMTKKLSEYFVSWEFNSFSDNGKVGEFPNNGTYPNNVRSLMTGNGFTVESTVETYLATQTASSTGDHRYVARSVVSMPKYKDKRGSENLKMSIYNTQLEVNSANTAQAQAREILAMAQADENPFVIIMGDTNDFTLTKEVWKIFEEGGFTPIVDTNTSTVSGTYDYNCIDNFFVSKRIKPLDYDVIWSQRYKWTNGSSGLNNQLSDHDLVIADVQLDYSDIRCINMNLSSPYFTSSYTKGWMTDKETITVVITPSEGKQVSSIWVGDCQMVNDEAVTVSGNSITIDGSKLVGDVMISVAVEDVATE